jgi:hypothetical protein
MMQKPILNTAPVKVEALNESECSMVIDNNEFLLLGCGLRVLRLSLSCCTSGEKTKVMSVHGNYVYCDSNLE